VKQLGALSLDLDNLWSYLKIHGDSQWSAYPTYLPTVVPTILQELHRAGFRITFFIVGRDAERPENTEALQGIVARGHDVGNHSYSHESWMHTYDREHVRDEIVRAEEAITKTMGVTPSGFRGPGFTISETILNVLSERRYAYDASTLPTFIGPIARAYYFRGSRLSESEREERGGLFGQWSDGRRPNRPFWWNDIQSAQESRPRRMLEIPVTVVPIVRIPFHLSYLLYIAGFSQDAALAYFTVALELCRRTKTFPSLLLHPLDFIGAGEAPGLEFFPGMNMSGDRKRAFVRRVLAIYERHVDVVAMDHAARALSAFPIGKSTVPGISPLSAT